MPKAPDTATEEIKAAMRRKKPKTLPLADFVSTGSTLLNLACSDRPNGGFAKGKYYFLVGDSASGKTWLSLTCNAEAAINPSFKDYEFIYDNVEDGALMDLTAYFGEAMVKRMRAPGADGTCSTTVESFYYNLDNTIKRSKKTGKPFIYVLDSQDALDSEAANEKFEENKVAHEKGKEKKGSYGDGKAKAHSENIRRALVGVRETGSILIVIGQTRDNISGMGDPKTRSGGRSLRFYATLEIWTSVREKLMKNVRGEPMQIGSLVKVQLKKNRFTGKLPTVYIPIYHSIGIDDTGSCVDYLLEWKHWSLKKIKGEESKVIIAPEFEFEGSRGQLIRHIEENNLEQDLRQIVTDVWGEIQEALVVPRKNRYA